MTETVNSGKLFSRIAQVMGKVRSLPKDGFNKQNSYNYVSSDNALDAIGKAMSEFGVVVIPSMVHYDTITDGKMTRAKAEFDMHICGVDGDVFTSRWTSEGIDYGNPDKALTKAITYATKTFLLKLFVVGAGGEDPDSESAPDDGNKAGARTQSQPAQTQRQQPAKPATNGTQHRQSAQPVQKPAQVDAEVKELADSVGATITSAEEFDAIPGAKQSDALDKARKAFHAECTGTFPKDDLDHARHWLIQSYTAKNTPDNARRSANDLTTEELVDLAGNLKQYRKGLAGRWAKEKDAWLEVQAVAA